MPSIGIKVHIEIQKWLWENKLEDSVSMWGKNDESKMLREMETIEEKSMQINES